MAEFPDVTLHYFDLRGRGQFIRGLLSHHQVPFTDDPGHSTQSCPPA